jgi:hypothetical protein
MLLQFFLWSESTALGAAIRESHWLFPAIMAVHLLALALIGGAILVVDLRLFGLGLRRQPVAQLARDAEPWLMGSLLVMVMTGILLFLSDPLKCYYSTPFWVKMSSLSLAIVFAFTVRRTVAAADETRVGPLWSKLVALISLTLWGTVAWGGRWIGMSGEV